VLVVDIVLSVELMVEVVLGELVVNLLVELVEADVILSVNIRGFITKPSSVTRVATNKLKDKQNFQKFVYLKKEKILVIPFYFELRVVQKWSFSFLAIFIFKLYIPNSHYTHQGCKRDDPRPSFSSPSLSPKKQP
jgi:hypothetical protein